MSEKTRINPANGNVDLIGGTTTDGVTIPQLPAAPGSPVAESAWVLDTYDFSYRTQEGTTKKLTLS